MEDSTNRTSGWRAVATKYHDELAKTMAVHGGRIMATSEINDIVAHHPILARDERWVYPSDHCVNHTNKGACTCAETEAAIFEKVRRGVYRVL